MAEPTPFPANMQDSGSPTSPPRVRKRLVAIGFFGVLAIIAVIFGGRAYLHGRTHESTDNAFIEGTVVPIAPKVAGQVLRVLVEDNQQVNEGQLLVEIDPADFQARLDQAEAMLAAATARLASARANCDLIKTTAPAGLAQAQSAVEAANSAVKTGQAKVGVAAAGIEQAKSALAAAQAALEQVGSELKGATAESERAASDLARYEEMIQTRAISQQQLDSARTVATTTAAAAAGAKQRETAARARVGEAQAGQSAAAEVLKRAEAELGEAQARVKQAEALRQAASAVPQQIAVAEAQVAMASADVKQAEAAMQYATLQRSYTRITAPRAGRVTKKGINAGAQVAVGQNLLAIVPLDVWVVANLKETQLDEIREGQEVAIRVDAYPGLRLRGHVDSIQRGTGSRFSLLPAENATGNYVKVVQRVPVKIVLDEQPAAQYVLAPGMSVEPDIKVK